MRFRNIVFTLNNYTPAEFDAIKSIECTYMVIGEEVGESGTPHLQGYIEFGKQYRQPTVKKMLPRAHFESRKGTPQQAADYCKKDGKFYESGEISHAGKRNDIEQFYEDIKQGKSELEIAEAHKSTYLRYHRGYDRLKFLMARQEKGFKQVQVIVLWGAAGTGKTKRAYDMDPDLYHWFPDEHLWFDGYSGQKTLLIDDFYGNIKYGKFLQLIDGYRFNLPIKGAFTWKAWDTVIITSNKHPRDWYPSMGYTEALERRLKSVTEVGV